MGVINQDSGQLNKLIGRYEYPLLEYWTAKFEDGLKSSMIPEFFDMIQSSNAFEAIGELTGTPTFREWAGEFTYGEVSEGNSKVFTPVVWEAGRAFDRFTLSNAKLLDLKTQVDKFNTEALRLRENICAGMFSNAASTSFVINGKTITNTTADGLALASASHVGSGTYTTTQSNYGTSALTPDNLEAAIQAMFDYKDDVGNYCNLQPDTLVVPTYLRGTALEIIGGPGKYNTANNNPNIYYGSMKLIVWPQFRKLSGAAGYPWFVMDSVAAKQSLKHINRLESGDMMDIQSWKDYETQTWKLGAIMWFVVGAFDWRPFYIQIPA
ncbi:MAG: Mu-like prophage major head subunit gpT family protein [Sphaerochaeta sp.]|jgi:hypothetical protein|nr:Mu-like prophage major head subunit gpT family protein [Sphaerochaeta sp.]